MSDPWPPEIMQSFFRGKDPNQHAMHERSAFNGPYNRLLWHLFNISGPYEVVPPWRVPLSSPYASLGAYQTPFTIELDRRPVFFVDVQPASWVNDHESRRDADERMRSYFRDSRERVATPYLHGVSAFGSRLRFHKYTLATNALEPAAIPTNLEVLKDLTPATVWDCDILDADGAPRFREVVESIFQMCQALEH